MVVSPIRASSRSPAGSIAAPGTGTETNVTTAILRSTSTADVRTAIDTLHDAKEEARLARAESAILRQKANDALKEAEETDAIAAQADAEVAAALEILGRAQRRASQRARHVNSPIAAVATTQQASDVGRDVVVYTDGSVIAGAHSAIGIFFGAGHPLNAGISLRANRHDSGLCELAAIQCALRLLLNNPDMRDRHIVIRTDYKNVLNSSRHETDRVFRAEYDRLRNLIEQFPRGVHYEHVEAHRGTFGNNEAHRLARDALRQSVQAANPARSRTNTASSSRANSKVSQRSTRSVDKSASRSSHTASNSGRSKSNASRKSTAASTARSIIPTVTARSGATTANSTRSKRATTSVRPAAAKANNSSASAPRSKSRIVSKKSNASSATTSVAASTAQSIKSTRSKRGLGMAKSIDKSSKSVSRSGSTSSSSGRPAPAKQLKPQTSVRVAKSSTVTKKSGTSGSTSVAVSTAKSIKSTRTARGALKTTTTVEKSSKSTRTTSKPAPGSSKKSLRSQRGRVSIKEDVKTARPALTPGRSPKKSQRDSTASKKSIKSSRSIKRPRTPAPEVRKGNHSKGSFSKSARQTATSPGSKQSDITTRSVGRQSSVSRTQNSNTNTGSRSGASGASRGANAGGRR